MSNFNKAVFRGTKGIVLHKQLLSRKFSKIKEYVHETKSLIEKKHNELEEHVGGELEGIEDATTASNIIEFYNEDFNKYENTYTELLMNSTFITAFSTFEHSFYRICQYAKNQKKAMVSVNDLSGNGIIVKCKKYIEKVIELDLSTLNKDWQELTYYNKIRNVLVHNAGSFKKEKTKPIEKQELYSFITNNPLIKQKNEKHGYFYIDNSQFIIEFCEKAEKYLLHIADLVLQVKKEV
ncbi:hypothetical protein [Labilibacter marinus]|uniref:hypothetical protein n=1 Tax=Labilibacter marinus TaxID=1477105 RepID=UPI00094F5FD5|nr:hypothetical protein [Labilibacter marinus]